MELERRCEEPSCDKTEIRQCCVGITVNELKMHPSYTFSQIK